MSASNQLSPGVVIQERDLSTVTTPSAFNVGVIAAPFNRGPVEEIVNISSERQLVNIFGEPDDQNFEFWYTASQFLAYGGLLKTIRVAGSLLKNSVSGSQTAELIKNLQDYETVYESRGSTTWNYASRTPGALGDSVGIFVTDAGADQIGAIPAPSSGNEHEFVADEAVSATSGAAGRVYKYSIKLTLSSVVGNFVAGTTADLTVGGSAQDVNVLAWNAADKILEISLPAGGVTGIIAEGSDTIAQTGISATIATAKRELLVGLNKNSIKFAAADSIADTNSTAVAITSVREEYAEREYLPGVKWINVAPRPATSIYSNSVGGWHDEMHILILDIDGKITGTPGAVLERYIGLSKASDAKTSVGEVNYYKEILKQKSNYIYWGKHETGAFLGTAGNAAAGDWGLSAVNRNFNIIRSAAGTTNYPAGDSTVGSRNNASFYYRLGGGADYVAPGGTITLTTSDIAAAYDLVSDPESQTIDFVLSGPAGATNEEALAKATTLMTLIDQRRDCMAFFSPKRSDVIGISNTTVITNNLVEYFDLLPSSSYAVFDSGYKYIYDKYNDVYRYVPCNGDIAGLLVQTTEVAEPWYSPAGFARGVLRNAIRLAYTPNKTQRDALYANRVNPIVSFPGQGIVLFGDKTGQGFASAFDRINVRRLFLVIERVIGTAAKTQLFEQNDEAQRNLFLNIVEPYLRDVQGRRGCTDFFVKCDSENNPPESVDRGEFYAEIYVKPTRTINYITLTFVATRTGVAFEEVAS
jgi:hypothetical protein